MSSSSLLCSVQNSSQDICFAYQGLLLITMYDEAYFIFVTFFYLCEIHRSRVFESSFRDFFHRHHYNWDSIFPKDWPYLGPHSPQSLGTLVLVHHCHGDSCHGYVPFKRPLDLQEGTPDCSLEMDKNPLDCVPLASKAPSIDTCHST